MHPEIDWTKPRRQSGIVILLALVKMAKLVWPVMAFLVARFFFNKGAGGGNFTHLLWGLAGTIAVFILIRINDIAGYFYYRYCIIDQELIIYSGFIVRKKTAVPLARIQAIYTLQTFLHKLTNTCRVLIDTAGTEKTEMAIDAIDIGLAKEFQLALTGKVTTPGTEMPLEETATEQPGTLHLGLNYPDLIKLCISENHVKTFLVIVGFFISRLDDIRDFLGFDSFGWMKQQSATVNTTARSVLLVFIVALLFSIVVSSIRVVLRYYGFSIRVQQQDFIMKWGLLETRQKHIRFKKVQLMSWRSTYLRRLMGMNILRLHATAEDEGKEDQMIQVPVTNPVHLDKIVNYYQPLRPAYHVPVTGIHKYYVSRQIQTIGLPVTAILAFGLYFVIGWYCLLTLAWLCYFAVSQWLYRKNFHIWISDQSIQVEKGVWGRENILLNYNNIQQVTIKTSPFKRKKQLADVQLHASGIVVTIPFLEKETADFMADFILANVEFEQEVLLLQKEMAKIDTAIE